MDIRTLEDILFHQTNQNSLKMEQITSPALISNAVDKDFKTPEAGQIEDVKLLDLFLGSVRRPQDYDNKVYHKKFMEKNADKVKEKIICPVCCGSYTYFNKSKHIKSDRHIKLLAKYGPVKFD